MRDASVSDNPYAPAVAPGGQGGPAGPRRGWPSWLIATVAIVGGLVLMAVPVTGELLFTSQAESDSASGAVVASPSPSSTPSPAPDPSADVGREQLDIDFPNGDTGSFAVPVGMQHDAGGDDEGHVAMWSVDPFGAPYLDVYTDDTAASRRSDLRGVAADERAFDVNKGGRASAIIYRSVGGHRAAQFTVQFKGKYADQVYDNLVTVVVVGHQILAVYFSDHPQTYVDQRAHADSAAVIRSFRPGSADDTT
jgi:aromatic ring-cleaving dioxygenase